ncbi:type II toxin-antitoxin system RelE/ParE family toxin [Maribacter chungangensis]|uniref:Type II toxin-antitoxin system RelE/ParE family toxin n=1 Tax=Maribacter chungangensis TaxID=1069117 RepID=A0ABW3AZ56_9FLAO
MARRIVWTSRADELFSEVLRFYVNRNKSKSYSRKLNREINKVVQLLSLYPFLGVKTDTKGIRVFIKGNFKIFYELKPNELIISLVWDNRQDPDKLLIQK